VRRCAQHEDVGAGAEDPRLQAGHDDRVDFGMLETNALERIGQLDVDAQIVRVELELVIGWTQSAVLLDVHRQRRHRPIDRQFPVLVLIR
jgi:hypothetical protein